MLRLIPLANRYLSSFPDLLLKESDSVEVLNESNEPLFLTLNPFLSNSGELTEFFEVWLTLDPDSFDSSGLANIRRRKLPFLLNLGRVLAVITVSVIVVGSSV